MTSTIRIATADDAVAAAEIYGPFCESTAVSFEYEPPSAGEMARRIRTVTGQFPWLVLDDDGFVAGYAYASRHKERAAYQWSVDTTVYVHPSRHRCGVGRALYTTLLQLLRLQGYFKAFAGVTLPNPASVGLHESFGFTLIGVERGVGYKRDAWHDVARYQLPLQPERLNPEPPVPVSSLVTSSEWVKTVAAGLKHYRP